MFRIEDEYRIKKDICEMGKRMYMRGYVAANDGNISVRMNENEIITTPTGISKGFMTPDMLCKIDMNGNSIYGSMKPSSEIKMHLEIYRQDPKVKAVTHAHPPYATAFAVARIPMDEPLMPEAIVNLGEVPVAEYAMPGSDDVPKSIRPYIKEYKSVLLANHGVVTWGKSVTEAFYRLETVEHYGQIYLLLKQLGKAHPLSNEEVSKIRSTLIK